MDRTPPSIGGVNAVTGRTRLLGVITGNGILRIASGASTVLVGAYIADLNRQGVSMGAGLVGGLAATAFGAELAGSIPLGILSDLVPVRTLMFAGALLAAAATLLFGLTYDVRILVASRILEGLAAAVGVPPMLAYLTDATASRAPLRARAMSYFELSLLAGLAFGGIVAGQLWNLFGVGAFIALSRAIRVSLVAMLGVCVALGVLNQMSGAPAALRSIVVGIVALLIMIESGFTPAALSLLAASVGMAAGRGGTMGVYSFLLSLGALVGSAVAGLAGQRLAIDGLTAATAICATAALALSYRLNHEPFVVSGVN